MHGMNNVLARWNLLEFTAAARAILPCCGSQAWADQLVSKRPITDEASLIGASAAIWSALPEQDWKEAFDSHPRIGQRCALAQATEESLRWSAEEQRIGNSEDGAVKLMLAEANRRYEQRFGRIFIVSAAGKTSAEILAILESRMRNDVMTELREAAEQQRQITQLRLHRWLESE
jgi:2-oxo-4-hydroxy-4-carboxy-5-ureidoimidazoline decarboxylase